MDGIAVAAGERIGDIYYKTLGGIANSSNPVWKSVITKRSSGTPAASFTNYFWYAKATTTPAYDADGNLLSDGRNGSTDEGRWVYTWDAENRLIKMESTPRAVTAGMSYTKLTFQYNWEGKRIARHVWRGGSAVSPVFLNSRRWIYDGWNPMNKMWLLLVFLSFFAFGCKGSSKELSENSLSLIFSTSWKSSGVLSDAKKMYVFESDLRGFVPVRKLRTSSRLVGEFEGTRVLDGISHLREVVSTNGASINGLKPRYQIVLVGKDDAHLAYWEILGSSMDGSATGDFVAVFPTGGVFRVSNIDELVKAARGKQ
ncbi:hypothetical protein [Luteolibacter luteus]|uniref:Uncharacterized protein n=1 Tax=Luteolibacter luteus TaxID=2728835 RepID=A0A858RFU3_9BACT|nr:hypothetical protein [Luteolibacter luteus]QJE95717.1 hypothetical protein HHL09_07935 [Luteolibacter luteus]